jgi:hypothetical protein
MEDRLELINVPGGPKGVARFGHGPILALGSVRTPRRDQGSRPDDNFNEDLWNNGKIC